MITPRNVLLMYGFLCIPVTLSIFFWPEYTLKRLKSTSSITGKPDELAVILTRWWGAAAMSIPAACLIAAFTGSQKTHRKMLKYFVIPYILLDCFMTYQHWSYVTSHSILKPSGLGVFHQNWLVSAFLLGASLLALYNVHTAAGLEKAHAEGAAAEATGSAPQAARVRGRSTE